MPYEIAYSDEAVQKLKDLRAFDRTAILDHIEQVLEVNPIQESKARIKMLRQPAPTQYRLRVGDFRVFYDVIGTTVQIIQILSKAEATSYLEDSP